MNLAADVLYRLNTESSLKFLVNRFHKPPFTFRFLWDNVGLQFNNNISALILVITVMFEIHLFSYYIKHNDK